MKVGSIATGSDDPIFIAISGNCAYVTYLFGDSLAIFDVANPAAPRKVGSVVDGLHDPSFVAISGNHMYVAFFDLDIHRFAGTELAGVCHNNHVGAKLVAVMLDQVQSRDR